MQSDTRPRAIGPGLAVVAGKEFPVRSRAIGLAFMIGMTGLAMAAAGCVQPNKVRNERHGLANTGAGSLMETRKALEGSWTLASLEAIDEQGARRPVKASGQLAYDAYSNMTIRATIEDPSLQTPLVLDYQGRISSIPSRKNSIRRISGRTNRSSSRRLR